MRTTPMANASTIERKWLVVDACWQDFRSSFFRSCGYPSRKTQTNLHTTR